jgi:hypothetical protein
MGFANTDFTDIITTTLHNRSGQIADNLTDNSPFLKRLKARGNIRPFSGGDFIVEELMYPDDSTDNSNSYSGYEEISIVPDSPISAAKFNIVQYADSVSINGLETLQNAGKEQVIDLLEARFKVSEARLQNRIATDLFLDGTGNGGKNITGLAAAVPDDPTTGTYGGIARATWSFWQSGKYSGVTDGGAAVSAANIQTYMTAAALARVRNNDMPDLYVADANYYKFYVASLQAIQRVATEGGANDIGALGNGASLKFYGGGMAADVIMDGGIGGHATANHMWLLNTKHLFFRPHKNRNFVPIGGDRQSVNQDAVVRLFGWAGNLTCDGAQFHSVVIA